MTILGARDLWRTYGIREVLRGVSLSVAEGERIGLVGRNGAGKSTLARILAGAEPPDRGEVVLRSGLRVGYLEQAPTFAPGLRAIDAALEGLGPWQAAIEQHEQLTTRLASASEAELDAILRRQAEAAATVERLGGWELRHEALALLGHVGITEVEAPVERMSGGERRRVALARLLVAQPDLAILDEPTNHLDLQTIAWLETWLSERFKGALILVTHDRYLLDRLVDRTIEVAEGQLHAYQGGWSLYLEAKAEREAHAERVEANRQNFLRRELEWLRRQPKARTTKQKARIDRAAVAIAQTGPKREVTAQIELGHVGEGRTILDVRHVAIDVPSNPPRRLLDTFDLQLGKGDRIGIVGPNGCGKTTLLRVLTGELAPTSGEVELGKRTKIAFLDQTRADLDDKATVHDNIAGGQTRVKLGELELDMRSYLERFAFDGHDQRRQVGTLSGGERARVALAKVLREEANLVILDEPTNDLDVMTLAAMEDALSEFAGVLLVVTHDRWFLDRIATSLLVFEGRKLVRHAGGWSDYVERKQLEQELAREAEASKPSASKPSGASKATEPSASGKPKKLTYAEELELAGLLERVDAAEQQVAALEALLGDEAFFQRPLADQRAFHAELERARAEAAKLAERWAELEDRR